MIIFMLVKSLNMIGSWSWGSTHEIKLQILANKYKQFQNYKSKILKYRILFNMVLKLKKIVCDV